MERKAAPVQEPTLPTTRADKRAAEAGFTLLEVVCVVAIISIFAAIIVPAFPRGTSRARIEAYALEAASLLKSDRNAAIRRRVEVAALVDARSRVVRAGASERIVRLPPDVAVETTLASACAGRRTASTINFLPTGMSCGGVITLARQGVGYQIRVNWLTGGVDVVSYVAR
jgi:general secretion pathway protein H